MTMPRDPKPAPPVAYVGGMLAATAGLLSGVAVACGAPWRPVLVTSTAAVPVFTFLVLTVGRLLEHAARRRAVRAHLRHLIDNDRSTHE